MSPTASAQIMTGVMCGFNPRSDVYFSKMFEGLLPQQPCCRCFTYM